jgi:3-methyladenine DNA glycosylase AlkC
MEPSLRDKIMSEKIGFKQKEHLADEYSKLHKTSICLKEAKELFNSNEYQIKMFAVFLLGNVAHDSTEALNFLKNVVSKDENWRVQEILAMSFALYYKKVGYTNALPTFNTWLNSENPNLRRAITEGLRPWTRFEYFNDHPQEAIKILSKYKEDESEYVRKSVGNALKDIGKKYRELLFTEINHWDLTNRKIAQTYKHAMRLILKKEIKNGKL